MTTVVGILSRRYKTIIDELEDFQYYADRFFIE